MVPTPTSSCYKCEQWRGLYNKLDGITNELAAGNSQLDDIQTKLLGPMHEAITGGFAGVASALEWGIEGLKWELEAQKSLLAGLDKSLKTPSQTKAREWQAMAEELRRRACYEQAISFGRRSIEENPLEYLTYVTLARAQIGAGLLDDAADTLIKSINHAPEPGNYQRAYSYRLISHIHACKEQYGLALVPICAAYQEVGSSWPEVGYDLCQMLCVNSDVEIIRHAGDIFAAWGHNWAVGAKQDLHLLRELSLRPAIEKSEALFYMAKVEPNFESKRTEIDRVLGRLMESARRQLERDVHQLERQAMSIDEPLESFNRSVGMSMLSGLMPPLRDRISKLSRLALEFHSQINIGGLREITASNDYSTLRRATKVAQAAFPKTEQLLKEFNAILDESLVLSQSRLFLAKDGN